MPTENSITNIPTVKETEKAEPVVETKKAPSDFVPKGYTTFEKSFGDLNKDGAEDCILIIKKVDPGNIITDEYRGKLDRNRRGLIILFKKNDGYELASKNYSCFSSENEDGGVYYAPELEVYAEKEKLYIHYAHGRYGYWTYTFRYGNSDFDLIGYDDSSNTGPRVNNTTSINFLTGKQLDKTNVNEEAESGDEVFKDSWKKLKTTKLLTLSEIKDFDELDLSSY
ncbi:hypothetical protein HHL23_04245 [Chryseobacterium sp. RP-3-3]|uniref:Uncharacterized protein n=1 Tax=Chryseobacterium antibioticum TaxID=2728847 RepID=A0A7Y0AKV1_9FLAO|nr:hypothetical protein [Chryseobacterium antibioticum]